MKFLKKHNLIYKITNIVNNKIYIGCHQTDEINDGYMGSGKILKKALLKYGLEKFLKEILYDFKTPEEMLNMESKIVDVEFVKRKDTYNLKVGGEGGWEHLKGSVTVKDSDGKTSRVSVTDSRYISGELKDIRSGHVIVKDSDGKTSRVSVTDSRYISGELVSVCKNMILVKDNQNNIFL